MKYAPIVILLCGLSFGQVAKKQPVKKVSKDSEIVALLKADLERERARSDDLDKRLQDSEHAKIEAQAKLAAAETVLGQIKTAAIQYIDYTQNLEKEYKATVEKYNGLVEKYNTTLNEANNIISRQNAVLARRQRVANALAAYSIMSNMKPYVIPQPQPPAFNNAPNNLHCTSAGVGNTTYTDCH